MLSFFVFLKSKEDYTENTQNVKNVRNVRNVRNIEKKNDSTFNINNIIKEVVSEDKNKDKKLGSKTYLYDFVDGEQPLNGLGPSYEQNYRSTLPKTNNMFVVPDLSVDYVNLLNTKNNRYH